MSPCQRIMRNSVDANILVIHDSGIWFSLLPLNILNEKWFSIILNKTVLVLEKVLIETS